VLGPQGRRGEVLAELHTDFPERFEERRRLTGLARDGSRRELQIEEYWFHKGGVVLKFAGVESISDAEQIKGLELQVPWEDRAKLELGAAYVSEIIGCEVWLTGAREPQLLGTVAEVQFGGGEAPLLVVRRSFEAALSSAESALQEFLIPYAEEFVRTSNFADRRIEMQLPEGLLELETPLSPEEKQQQKMEADESHRVGVRGKRRR